MTLVTAIVKNKTTVTAATNSVTISGADADVENSDSSYSTTVASGGSLVVPNITVTDSDGSTSSVPSVQDVTCTPSPTDLKVYVEIADASDTSTFTILSGSEGTITAVDNSSLTSVAITVNAGAVSVPFALAISDVVIITYGTAVSDDVITLTGTY